MANSQEDSLDIDLLNAERADVFVRCIKKTIQNCIKGHQFHQVMKSFL